SLIGYAVSGAFLGLAYFDYYYALLAIIVGMTTVIKQQAEQPVRTPTGESRLPDRWSIGTERWGIQPAPRSKFKELFALGKQWYDRL
ncbi:MAG: hypothetical protein WBG92_24515, partial [Thiohalocapsa sp.]